MLQHGHSWEPFCGIFGDGVQHLLSPSGFRGVLAFSFGFSSTRLQHTHCNRLPMMETILTPQSPQQQQNFCSYAVLTQLSAIYHSNHNTLLTQHSLLDAPPKALCAPRSLQYFKMHTLKITLFTHHTRYNDFSSSHTLHAQVIQDTIFTYITLSTQHILYIIHALQHIWLHNTSTFIRNQHIHYSTLIQQQRGWQISLNITYSLHSIA